MFTTKSLQFSTAFTNGVMRGSSSPDAIAAASDTQKRVEARSIRRVSNMQNLRLLQQSVKTVGFTTNRSVNGSFGSPENAA